MEVRFVSHNSHNLTDEEWRMVEALIPIKTGTGIGPGKPRTLDMRQVVNALLYIEYTGCQWRNMPKDFPNHNSVRYYFDAWRKDGTWHNILQMLNKERQEHSSHVWHERPPVNSYAFGDR